MENDGDGIKLHFTRAESARVAQKTYTSKDRKTTRKAGDIYYRDCAVTGSNEGTPQEPKFPLLRWFHELAGGVDFFGDRLAVAPEVKNGARRTS